MANKSNQDTKRDLEQLRSKYLSEIIKIESKNINSKYTKEDQNAEKLPHILEIQRIDRELGKLR